MTTTSRLAALFCFAACLGTIAPAPLTAQTPPDNAKAERIIPDLELHGTLVRDAVAYLRHQVPEVNIVVGGGAGDVRIPELVLRNVTLTQALLALRPATGGEVAVNLPGPQAPDVFTIVDMRPQAPKPPNAPPETITRVFLLSSWPEADFDRSVAATLDAVNHLFALARNARAASAGANTELKPPLLEAHRPTHLLLVAGTREGVELASQVITMLQGIPLKTDPERSPDKPAKPTE